jgi:hypothetical protein
MRSEWRNGAKNMATGDQSNIVMAAAIASGCFLCGFWIRRVESAAKSWSQAEGTITTSKTKRVPTRKGLEQLCPVIEYEFSHEGKLYKTDHWRFGNFSVGDKEGAETTVARFPVRAKVVVYVNSRKPTKSVLEATPSVLCWVPFGFGLLFTWITLVLLCEMVAENK